MPAGAGLAGYGLALGVCHGQLVAAGNFTAAGGAAAANVAAWSD